MKSSVIVRYLLCVLSILLGMVSLIANSKDLIDFPGLLYISVILMVSPGLLVALRKDRFGFGEGLSVGLVAIPLLCINYIFYLRMGAPVGFVDTHLNISQEQFLFDQGGHLLFQNAQTISFNFVGMYILYHGIGEILNFDVTLIASIIPPAINILIALSTYLIVRKLHSHNLALIVAILFGWEHDILIYGQEMRTQTVGTLLFFILIYFLIVRRDAIIRKTLSETLLIIILLAGFVTISFVSVFYAIIVLLMMLLAKWFLPHALHWQIARFRFTWRLLGVFTIFFVSYLFFIGINFQNILPTIMQLIRETLTKTEETLTVRFYSSIYGDFVSLLNSAFTAIFVGSLILYLIYISKGRNTQRGIFLAGLGILLVFFAFNNLFGPLSAGRAYIVAFILIAVAFGLCILKLTEINRRLLRRKLTVAIAYLLIVFFIFASVASFPHYLIGQTTPLRDQQPIDQVDYWDVDFPQYALSSFLDFSATHKAIHAFMVIKNYYFLDVCNENGLAVVSVETIYQGDLVILHDKFFGQNYTYRYLLPSADQFEELDMLYSNGDYFIYINPKA